MGRFGQLSVSDSEGVRSLDCNWACHGSSFLLPAGELAGASHQPGPVPESDYMLGWLIAAAAAPDGHVLMGGLGSGAGPIALAWAFPRLRVTVVEIDPAIIALARRHFPLLPALEAAGRIAVVQQDVVEHVWRARDAGWSLACLDAYRDSSGLYCPPALLQALHGRAAAVWLNILEGADFAATRQLADALVDTGWTPVSVLPVNEVPQGTERGNVLLGTQAPAMPLLRGFRPFGGLDHPHARKADARLAGMLARRQAWSRIALADHGPDPLEPAFPSRDAQRPGRRP